MSIIYQSDIQIAVGNNNTAGLVAWESLLPTNDINFLPVRSFGTYDAGEQKTRTNGTPYFAGVETISFLAVVMTRAQFFYLKSTYCAGGYSGAVTIHARLDDPDTYEDLNATMVLTKESELEYRHTSYLSVNVRFIDLEVIP